MRRVPARKHRSWESRRLATASPARRASARTSGLVSSPSGNRRRCSEAGASALQRVALILGRIDGRPQQRPERGLVAVDARVVAGRELASSQPGGEIEHRVEAHRAVAAHARVGREASRVIGQPRLHDAGAKLGAQVDREMGHAEIVRERASAAHGLSGAAAGLAVVGGVRPQLERDRHRLVSHSGGEQRGDGRVDSAAHRHERALGDRREARVAQGGAERAVQRVGGELDGVALGRGQPSELPRDRLGADQGRIQQGRVAQQRDDRTAGRDRGAAAARVEAGVEDAPVGSVGVECERDADQIAARRPARGAGVRAGGGVPARERAFEVLDQARGECHTVECKDCSGLAGRRRRRGPAAVRSARCAASDRGSRRTRSRGAAAGNAAGVRSGGIRRRPAGSRRRRRDP